MQIAILGGTSANRIKEILNQRADNLTVDIYPTLQAYMDSQLQRFVPYARTIIVEDAYTNLGANALPILQQFVQYVSSTLPDMRVVALVKDAEVINTFAENLTGPTYVTIKLLKTTQALLIDSAVAGVTELRTKYADVVAKQTTDAIQNVTEAPPKQQTQQAAPPPKKKRGGLFGGKKDKSQKAGNSPATPQSGNAGAGFGSPAPGFAGGFGNNNGGFGASAQQNGFGAPAQQTGFGAPAQQTGFGAPAQQTGFGGFGQQGNTNPFGAAPAPAQPADAAPASNSFGSGGFGTPPADNGFGSGGFGTPPADSGFGTGGFGTPPEDSGFGSGGFGTTPADNGFGSGSFGTPPADSGFGSGGFGTPPEDSGFGSGGFSTPPADNGFGSGGFGAPAQGSAFGGFNAAPSPAAAEVTEADDDDFAMPQQSAPIGSTFDFSKENPQVVDDLPVQPNFGMQGIMQVTDMDEAPDEAPEPTAMPAFTGFGTPDSTSSAFNNSFDDLTPQGGMGAFDAGLNAAPSNIEIKKADKSRVTARNNASAYDFRGAAQNIQVQRGDANAHNTAVEEAADAGMDMTAMYGLADAAYAQQFAPAPQVVEKVVEREVYIETGKDMPTEKLLSAGKQVIIVVTGDRRSGVTYTAISLASLYAKKYSTLLVDLDTDTCGGQLYQDTECLIGEEENVQHGLLRCRNPQMLTNLIHHNNDSGYDYLFSLVGNDPVTVAQLQTIANVLSVQRSHQLVIIDCPWKNLTAIDDLLTKAKIFICVDADVTGAHNTVELLNAIPPASKMAQTMQLSAVYLSKQGTNTQNLVNSMAWLNDMFEVDEAEGTFPWATLKIAGSADSSALPDLMKRF